VLLGQIMDAIKGLTDSVTEVQKIHMQRRATKKDTKNDEMKAESPAKGYSG